MTGTSIELGDDLIREVMERHGFKAKSEAVRFALRLLASAPMTRDEALAMRGSGWEGNLDGMRGGFGVDDA